MLLILWKTIFFCVTEIFLTLLELDELADYSEFTFNVKGTSIARYSELVEYECCHDQSRLVCRSQVSMVL